MRICLVTHGFPPVERTGVENYTEALARSFVRGGHTVTVFAPRRDPQAANLSLHEEERDGYVVQWIALNDVPVDPREALDAPGVARRFAGLLDRERPEVIHFQHAIKVGLGCLRVARERGLPIVYTAHDYFAVCHRYTLLRPDLSHCDVRGDSMACARCDLAVSRLNRIGSLGDYQIGVLSNQIADDELHALQAILADETARAGVSVDEHDAAFDRRLELDALRARSFAGVDLILAPSAYLATELVRGGLERDRIEVLAYGIANEDLRGLPAPAADDARPVRFGYFGGFSKHKGVHLLLEAFGQLGGRAELTLNGYSTDEPYVRLLREEAARTGAIWRGPYEREELPELLGEVDVVVVPSIWVENQPIVIREAFSAGRPVLASRIGAIPESVSEGKDGLLFEPGDVADLTRVLREASEHALVRRLAAGIGPVKGLEAHAAELLERYEALLRARTRTAPAPSLPASVQRFAARQRALEELPSRELFARVLDGLGRLRAGLLGKSGPGLEQILAQALGSGSKSQAGLREAQEETTWLRTEKVAGERERAWLRGIFDEGEKERRWLREKLAERDREQEWLRGKLEELVVVEMERRRLRDALDQRDREQQLLRGKLQELDAGRTELLSEHERVTASLDQTRVELRSTSQLALAVLSAQERAFRDELSSLFAAAGTIPESTADLAGLLAALRNGVDRVRELRAELEWRRGEMSAAEQEARRKLARLVLRHSGLGRRVGGWAARGEKEAP